MMVTKAQLRSAVDTALEAVIGNLFSVAELNGASQRIAVRQEEIRRGLGIALENYDIFMKEIDELVL